MIQVFPFLVKFAFAGERDRTFVTGCNRGGDQAEETQVKYVVTPEFPSLYKRPLTCKWTVNTNHGKFVKLVPDTFDLPCLGNNGLVIEDVGMGYSGAKSVSFCGKKNIPAFVSSDVKFEIHLTIDDPGPRGVRLKLGYKVVGKTDGIKVKQFSNPMSSFRGRQNIGNVGRTSVLNSSSRNNWTPRNNAQSAQNTGSYRFSGRPSPMWHQNQLIPKVVSPSTNTLGTGIRSPEMIEEFAIQRRKQEMMIVLAYIGLAIVLVIPTIAILIVLRRKTSKLDES